jgi:DNA-binding transcriptional LysR family regulator
MEMAFDLRALDFAALRTLRLVHAHGSFSRTAEMLGVAQSTVSYTISRLRDTFGDPLFVRQGSEMVSTQRCDEIVAQSSELLDRFEAMAAPREFDPALAALEVAISCNYYERVTLIPQVMRALRSEAPGIRLKIISSTVRGKRQLTRSESDILIGPIQIHETGYFKRALLKDDYVCIMDPANPLAQADLDVDAFVSAPQVIVNYGGNFQSRFLSDMERAGYAPNTVMEVPSPANLYGLLHQTDMIATVPKRIAHTFKDTVATVACPFPSRFPIDMFWTARTHASAPHTWLRSIIATAASRLVKA